MSASIRPRVGDLTSAYETSGATKHGILAAGGLLAAIGASSCCVLPMVLFSVGVSGAWIGNLTALAPYQPYFIAAAVALLGAGFLGAYRLPRTACVGEKSCATPASTRLTKFGLWAAAILIVAALAFPYAAGLFLDV